jgi:hypothetical protein
MTGLVRQTNITKQRRVLPARASMCCGNRDREATEWMRAIEAESGESSRKVSV